MTVKTRVRRGMRVALLSAALLCCTCQVFAEVPLDPWDLCPHLLKEDLSDYSLARFSLSQYCARVGLLPLGQWTMRLIDVRLDRYRMFSSRLNLAGFHMQTERLLVDRPDLRSWQAPDARVGLYIGSVALDGVALRLQRLQGDPDNLYLERVPRNRTSLSTRFMQPAHPNYSMPRRTYDAFDLEL